LYLLYLFSIEFKTLCELCFVFLNSHIIFLSPPPTSLLPLPACGLPLPPPPPSLPLFPLLRLSSAAPARSSPLALRLPPPPPLLSSWSLSFFSSPCLSPPLSFSPPSPLPPPPPFPSVFSSRSLYLI
jgi:hypothetical protein